MWTGRPVHARIRRADAGLALYLVAVLVVLALVCTRWLPGVSLPGYFKVLIVTVYGLGALQVIGTLVGLLVTGPARQRRTVYEVTNYRVIVSCGRGAEDSTSVYLDQLDARMVRPDPDGTGDVLLRAGSGSTDNWQRMRTLFRPGGLGLAAVDSVAGPAVPGEITIAPGEEVLWAGAPAGIPWWFGGRDVYVTVFGLAWLAFVTGMGVLTAQSGNGPFFLVWLGLMAPPLDTLLPPVIRGTSVITGLASADASSRRQAWKELMWPAATVTPPVFIGLANAQEIAGLIGAAQVATRAPVNK